MARKNEAVHYGIEGRDRQHNIITSKRTNQMSKYAKDIEELKINAAENSKDHDCFTDDITDLKSAM